MNATPSDRLFAARCDFVLAASEPEHFPPDKLPEVAFWGRSNVGKSSLVNALTGRKALARASKTPGRTQQIIFFNLGGRLMLADLPGYGHAKAPRTERHRWNELIHHYLKTRPQLKCVCLLIDARHGLLTNDSEAMDQLDRAAVSTRVVLTKIDLVPVGEREDRSRQVSLAVERHPAIRPGLMAVSAERGVGIEELRSFVAGFATTKTR